MTWFEIGVLALLFYISLELHFCRKLLHFISKQAEQARGILVDVYWRIPHRPGKEKTIEEMMGLNPEQIAQLEESRKK